MKRFIEYCGIIIPVIAAMVFLGIGCWTIGVFVDLNYISLHYIIRIVLCFSLVFWELHQYGERVDSFIKKYCEQE